MTQSKCPVCGCEQFYLKDPDDEFEVYEFECRDGEVCFAPGPGSAQCPEIDESTEIFCNACAWHDMLEKIK
jgi:hypothetical protein